MSKAAPARLPLRSVLAFAFAYLPFAALTLAVAVQLPKFFASSLGVGLAIGGLFGLVRLIDIPVDPLLGLAMDRTRTPLGRYRPWMLVGAPILMLALYELFQAQVGVGRWTIMVWLLVMYLGMSILLVAGNSWASTLAPTYQERSRIFGAMSALGVVGAASVLLIPTVIAKHVGETQSVRVIGWFLTALVPVAVGITVLSTPERLVHDAHGRRFTLRDYGALLVRPNVLRLLLADLSVTLGPGWMAALYYFYWEASRQVSYAASSMLLLIYILAGLAGAPATAWLGNRIGKHRALIATTTLYSLFLMIIPLTPKGLSWPSFPIMFCLGSFAAGFVVMIRAITADVGDEIRLENGAQQMGLLYALTSATTKIAGAFSITFTFKVLDLVGYNPKPGAINGPDQIHGLELAFIVGPIAFVMLGGACFLGYKLTAERHADIRRQLDERDALYEEAAVLQSVTGQPDGVATSAS
ncbi:MAG: MFS transporter [Alphaproteobacteria bacterium]|nr:MFS transporter [Alphaproteobacteria bacterium]